MDAFQREWGRKLLTQVEAKPMLVWIPVRVRHIGAAGLDIRYNVGVLFLRHGPRGPQGAVAAVRPEPPALELHWDAPLACYLLLKLAKGRLPLQPVALYL